MGLLRGIRSLFSTATVKPPYLHRLNGSSEAGLAASLRALRPAQRGWITLREARSLFSRAEHQYAFGEIDEDGKMALALFAAQAEHRCDYHFMPVEGRLYFNRKPD